MRKTLSQEQYEFISSLPDLYGNALMKYAVRFLGYKPHLLHIAEDAVQEVYLKAIENADALLRHANPSAWLKLCLKRILLNHLRSANFLREELTEDFSLHPAASAQAVQAALERWQTQAALQDVQKIAALLLSPAEQQTFADHFLQGLTTEETARLEGLPAATVRGRISRIRKKLKKIFLSLCCFAFMMCQIIWR